MISATVCRRERRLSGAGVEAQSYAAQDAGGMTISTDTNTVGNGGTLIRRRRR